MHTKKYNVRLDIAFAAGAGADFAGFHRLPHRVLRHSCMAAYAVGCVKVSCSWQGLPPLDFETGS